MYEPLAQQIFVKRVEHMPAHSVTQIDTTVPIQDVEPLRILTPEAKRALAEAEQRRQQAFDEKARPSEVGGRGGPDPVRYGDWEKGGIAWDF